MDLLSYKIWTFDGKITSDEATINQEKLYCWKNTEPLIDSACKSAQPNVTVCTVVAVGSFIGLV